MCFVQGQTDVAGGSQPQSTLAPVGAATSDHARPVGPKHDRSPEQMQVHTVYILYLYTQQCGV